MINHDIQFSNEQKIAILKDSGHWISSAQEFLELIMNLRCDVVVLAKENIIEDFFDLRTGLAGEILQKAINYRVKVAIVGDFSGYISKSLQAFILESNRQKNIAFCQSESEAIKKFVTQ